MFPFRSAYTFFVSFVCLLYLNGLTGQTTLIIESLPNNVPLDRAVFISGDFEGWTGGQDDFKLNLQEGQYSITLPEHINAISFKFTRGSWESVEVDRTGNQIDNRTFEDLAVKDSLYFSIQNWHDLIEEKSTASPNVSIMDEAFEMPELGRKRKIWIYLPPDYEHSSKYYPVLYMHDGQNLFDDAIAFSGEWSVDETLNRLSMEKKLELIVVGIENGGEERISEYSPWDIPKYNAKAQGDAYVNFIIEALKPYVDNEYRTLSNSTNTALMGSSLGGVISHYAALKKSDVFGKSAVFSPSFELFPDSFDFAKKHAGPKNSKMYLMAGDQESEFMVYKMNEMAEIMTLAEFPKSNIRLKVVKGGEHNENLWKNEFEEAITWLFLSE